jgi:WhiB family redox-sensing transcriptional regulator
MWMTRGTCAEVDPDLWQPTGGASPEAAKRICRECPVVRICLEHALARPGIDGVWGATSERQRQRIRAARRAA